MKKIFTLLAVMMMAISSALAATIPTSLQQRGSSITQAAQAAINWDEIAYVPNNSEDAEYTDTYKVYSPDFETSAVVFDEDGRTYIQFSKDENKYSIDWVEGVSDFFEAPGKLNIHVNSFNEELTEVTLTLLDYDTDENKTAVITVLKKKKAQEDAPASAYDIDMVFENGNSVFFNANEGLYTYSTVNNLDFDTPLIVFGSSLVSGHFTLADLVNGSGYMLNAYDSTVSFSTVEGDITRVQSTTDPTKDDITIELTGVLSDDRTVHAKATGVVAHVEASVAKPAAPVISPEGGVFESEIPEVTISQADGKAIYFSITLDGDERVVAEEYNGNRQVFGNAFNEVIVTAWAVDNGVSSDTVTNVYTLAKDEPVAKPAAPVISPEGGVFESEIPEVTISQADGKAIYFSITLDGDERVVAEEYNGNRQVFGNAFNEVIVTAWAVDNGVSSDTVTNVYTLAKDEPVAEDLTAKVSVEQADWSATGGFNFPVTTADGRTANMVEHYYKEYTELSTGVQTPLSQTVTGLENGIYEVTLFATANSADWDLACPDFVNNSTEYASVFAYGANAADAQTAAIEAHSNNRGYAENDPAKYTIENVTVSNGSITFGVQANDGCLANWFTAQIYSLKRTGELDVTGPSEEDLASFQGVKDAYVELLNDRAQQNNSQAVLDIIAKAKEDIANLGYDTLKDVNGNKQALYEILTQALADIQAQRAADEEAAAKAIVPDVALNNIDALLQNNFAFGTTGRFFYSTGAQNLGFDAQETAFAESVVAYTWKLEEVPGTQGQYYIKAVTPAGEDYSFWGRTGVNYLNSQTETGWCSFVLGLTNDEGTTVNGQDIDNGAVWELEYDEAAQGFAVKNVGTGLYLGASTGAANSATPVYFTFTTLRKAGDLPSDAEPVAISSVESTSAQKAGKFVENGKVVIVKNGRKYNVAGQLIK